MKPLLLASGMRRGGSTLQFQILGDILRASGVCFESKYVDELEGADLAPGPDGIVRVVKTHAVPKEAVNSGAGHMQCFHIYRDPRDALVSYLAKYESAYTDERASRFLRMIQTEFNYWRGIEGVYTVRYEDIVSALSGEVARCARAMGADLGPDEIGRIAESRSLESQKRRIKEVDWGAESTIRNGQDLIDPETQLHSNHIRTGGCGAWQQELNKSGAAFIEANFGDWIEEMGYPLITSRWQRWRHRI
ncbi:sulfotransferase domain-containing protein [Thermomonas sp.]|uniref:sulfotransferase domain-containing protein n=1 Tax=Thermomonas sp. TaxID=1971895 RepID=UPI002C20F09F|nr:sulfotransferase domain-containing protein [Thermomonas sp.]HRO63194.1 sulfotransferase domain-containing protein [Thermomonas sp.]